MANQKITGLTADTTPAAADLLHLVADVATTAVNRKVLLSDLFIGITITAAETTASVTPTNLEFNPPNAKRYGLATTATGAVNRLAIANSLAANTAVYIPAGTYTISGAVITIPGGGIVFGDGDGNEQATGSILQRGSGDFLSFFNTDDTLSSFAGITLANFQLQGGTSATWSDVSAKWAIQSHYPFTRIVGVHIEPTADFFGNGIRLHNDNASTNGGSMGCWASSLDHVRFVGTPGTPADNTQIGLDILINGGFVRISNTSVQRSNLGIWIRRGDHIALENVDLENIRSGAAATRTEAAVIVGEVNSEHRVRGFSFKGFIEAAGRAFVLQNVRGAKIYGSYMNATRSFSPSGGADGFIYINSGAKGVSIENNYIETQYNLPDAIFSDGEDYNSEGNTLFVNVTNSSGVPQAYFGGGRVYGGTGTLARGPHRSNDDGVFLDDSAASDAIENVTASGSLIQLTLTAHGLATGGRVWVEGITGTVGAAANLKLWEITKVDNDNITLDGSLHSGAYTSGGNIHTPDLFTSENTFTGTLTGCTTSPTGTIEYTIEGYTVLLEIPAISGTSNTTAATVTGMPIEIRPLTAQTISGVTQDNGTTAAGDLIIGTDGVITLHVGQSATFTSSGTKGISARTIMYRLR